MKSMVMYSRLSEVVKRIKSHYVNVCMNVEETSCCWQLTAEVKTWLS